MDPNVVIAVIVALQVIWQAWIKYKTDKPTSETAQHTALASVVDKRIQLIIDAQTAEIARLQAIVAKLTEVQNEITPPGGEEG